MGNTLTRKQLLLQQFTRVMFEHDPVGLKYAGGNDEHEYEPEALSVLARFNEGALHMCEDEALRQEIAVGFVKQAFAFWFNDVEVSGLEELSEALLRTFEDAYPTREQLAADKVLSKP